MHDRKPDPAANARLHSAENFAHAAAHVRSRLHPMQAWQPKRNRFEKTQTSWIFRATLARVVEAIRIAQIQQVVIRSLPQPKLHKANSKQKKSSLCQIAPFGSESRAKAGASASQTCTAKRGVFKKTITSRTKTNLSGVVVCEHRPFAATLTKHIIRENTKVSIVFTLNSERRKFVAIVRIEILFEIIDHAVHRMTTGSHITEKIS